MPNNKHTIWRAEDLIARLDDERLFVDVANFPEGVDVEIYRPVGVDRQQPHDRDELYFVVSGTGIFESGDDRMDFSPGDALFVPAHRRHRFVEFSDDFATWVIFFGPTKTAED